MYSCMQNRHFNAAEKKKRSLSKMFQFRFIWISEDGARIKHILVRFKMGAEVATLRIPYRRKYTELVLFFILTFGGSSIRNFWDSPRASCCHRYYSRARFLYIESIRQVWQYILSLTILAESKSEYCINFVTVDKWEMAAKKHRNQHSKMNHQMELLFYPQTNWTITVLEYE